MCRRLAAGSGPAVLAVDYRLAAEHPWPASVDDTAAVLRRVASGPTELGGRPDAVAVAGDSAGGTLAALACPRLRDRCPDALPDLQVLLYANTDLTGAQPRWVPDPARRSDPRVSPLRARDLSGLPRALVVSAEHDPLRDESDLARLPGGRGSGRGRPAGPPPRPWRHYPSVATMTDRMHRRYHVTR